MKYLILSLSMLFAVSLFSQESDYDAVVRTLKYYTEGGTNNDWDTFKKAFHETATMKCIRDGKYKEVNALEFFSGMKPGPPSDRHTRIANVEIFGSAASAQIILMYKDAYVVDFMNLIKIDGEWKIVNKIFDGTKRTFRNDE